MLDKNVVFNSFRTVFGSYTQDQVDGINKIIDEFENRNLSDLRYLAYILATVYHETAKTMQPISEYGGINYLKSKKYYPWYGRGLVQITWEVNYKKFGILKPDDALLWPVALKVLYDGMLKGMFTTHKLSDYFNVIEDPLNARKIVNGTDKASLIASYYTVFLQGLKKASGGPQKPAVVVVKPTLGNIPVTISIPSTPPPEPVKDPWYKRWFFKR